MMLTEYTFPPHHSQTGPRRLMKLHEHPHERERKRAWTVEDDSPRKSPTCLRKCQNSLFDRRMPSLLSGRFWNNLYSVF